MSIKNAIKNLRVAPDNTLIVLLLKQFKGLLEEHGVELDTKTMHAVAQQAADCEPLSELGKSAGTALVAIVDESVRLLEERFHLTFARSMVTDANLLTGWRTPAEFQELLTQKNNAETRIAMGATLLAMFGDKRFITYVFTTVEYEYVRGHMEAMLAMRALSHAAQIDPATEDWERKAREALFP